MKTLVQGITNCLVYAVAINNTRNSKMADPSMHARLQFHSIISSPMSSALLLHTVPRISNISQCITSNFHHFVHIHRHINEIPVL